jgi:hypothetical protein
MPDPALLTDAVRSHADYDQDYHAWLIDNARLLREGRLSEIDVAHIAEELQDMGNSERRAIESFLRLLMLHLLKWRHQPGLRGSSWAQSVDNARYEIKRRLTESPSLRPRVPELAEHAYANARRNAMRETGLPLDTFPADCPFTIEQLLDDDYWPD